MHQLRDPFFFVDGILILEVAVKPPSVILALHQQCLFVHVLFMYSVNLSYHGLSVSDSRSTDNGSVSALGVCD